MDFRRTYMQARDLFLVRAHLGWVDFLAQRLARKLPSPAPALADRLHARLSAHTDARSRAFDQQYGTETFTRFDVAVSEGVPVEELAWGYGPINQDFFREIMRAIPVDLSTFDFVDVGAGKGAAVMLASELGFRHCYAVELDAVLLELARANVAKYEAATGRSVPVSYVQTDFFKWDPPGDSPLFFLNNPFPEALGVKAVEKLEETLRARPRRALLVYRKAPAGVGDALHRSREWAPLRLTPYWRVYASKDLARELGAGR